MMYAICFKIFQLGDRKGGGRVKTDLPMFIIIETK